MSAGRCVDVNDSEEASCTYVHCDAITKQIQRSETRAVHRVLEHCVPKLLIYAPLATFELRVFTSIIISLVAPVSGYPRVCERMSDGNVN